MKASVRRFGGWAVSEAENEIRRNQTNLLPLRSRARIVLSERPIAYPIGGQLVVCAISLAAYIARPDFWASLAPDDATSLLTAAWQVHAGFTAIAFAGLTLLIEMAGRESETNFIDQKRSLLDETFFLPVFVFALAGSVQLGVAAAWFDEDAVSAAQLFLVVFMTIVLVGTAYARAVVILTDASRARGIQRKALLDKLRASLVASEAVRLANLRLNLRVPFRAYDPSDSGQYVLLSSNENSRLTDIHLGRVDQALAILRSTALLHSARPAPGGGALIYSNCRIGSILVPGEPIFFTYVVIRGKPALFASDLLSRSVEVDEL